MRWLQGYIACLCWVIFIPFNVQATKLLGSTDLGKFVYIDVNDTELALPIPTIQPGNTFWKAVDPDGRLWLVNEAPPGSKDPEIRLTGICNFKRCWYRRWKLDFALNIMAVEWDPTIQSIHILTAQCPGANTSTIITITPNLETTGSTNMTYTLLTFKGTKCENYVYPTQGMQSAFDPFERIFFLWCQSNIVVLRLEPEPYIVHTIPGPWDRISLNYDPNAQLLYLWPTTETGSHSEIAWLNPFTLTQGKFPIVLPGGHYAKEWLPRSPTLLDVSQQVLYFGTLDGVGWIDLNACVQPRQYSAIQCMVAGIEKLPASFTFFNFHLVPDWNVKDILPFVDGDFEPPAPKCDILDWHFDDKSCPRFDMQAWGAKRDFRDSGRCDQGRMVYDENKLRRVHTVHVVSVTHFDNGYTDYSHCVLQHYFSNVFPGVLDEMDINPSYTYATQGFLIWAFTKCSTLKAKGYLKPFKTLPPIECPSEANQQRLRTAIHSGRFTYSAFPMNLLGGTSGRILFEAGLATMKELSEDTLQLPKAKWPKTAYFLDVSGMSRSMIPQLNHAGVKGVYWGPNPEFGNQPRDKRGRPLPSVFNWTAPNGKSVVAMIHPHHYGGMTVYDAVYHGGHALVVNFCLENSKHPSLPTEGDMLRNMEPVKMRNNWLLASGGGWGFNGKGTHTGNLTFKASSFDAFLESVLEEVERGDAPPLQEYQQDLQDPWVRSLQSDPVRVAQYRSMARAMERTVWSQLPRPYTIVNVSQQTQVETVLQKRDEDEAPYLEDGPDEDTNPNPGLQATGYNTSLNLTEIGTMGMMIMLGGPEHNYGIGGWQVGKDMFVKGWTLDSLVEKQSSMKAAFDAGMRDLPSLSRNLLAEARTLPKRRNYTELVQGWQKVETTEKTPCTLGGQSITRMGFDKFGGLCYYGPIELDSEHDMDGRHLGRPVVQWLVSAGLYTSYGSLEAVYYKKHDDDSFSYLANIQIIDYSNRLDKQPNLTVWSRWDTMPGCAICLIHSLQLDFADPNLYLNDPFRCLIDGGCFQTPRNYFGTSLGISYQPKKASEETEYVLDVDGEALRPKKTAACMSRYMYSPWSGIELRDMQTAHSPFRMMSFDSGMLAFKGTPRNYTSRINGWESSEPVPFLLWADQDRGYDVAPDFSSGFAFNLYNLMDLNWAKQYPLSKYSPGTTFRFFLSFPRLEPRPSRPTHHKKDMEAEWGACLLVTTSLLIGLGLYLKVKTDGDGESIAERIPFSNRQESFIQDHFNRRPSGLTRLQLPPPDAEDASTEHYDSGMSSRTSSTYPSPLRSQADV